MPLINTYSPSDIVLSINDFIVTDFAEGSFLEINQNSFNYRQVRGIRGKHTRIHTRDRSGAIMFRLMQTSTQNQTLSQLANADDLDQTGLMLVTIRDAGGDTGVQFGNAYLEGNPNLSWQARTTSPIEWRIYYEFTTRYDVGGNSRGVLDLLSNIPNIF